jgi:hypothetical protein
MITLFDEIHKDLKEILKDPKYADFIKEKDIDPKLFLEFFDALINTRLIIDEDENKIDDAKISMLNTLKNKFLNQEK